MDVRLYFHDSWEYIPARNGTCYTYAFFFSVQGQTSCAYLHTAISTAIPAEKKDFPVLYKRNIWSFWIQTPSLIAAAPHSLTAVLCLSLSPVWLTSWSTKEHIWENHSFLNTMFAWEWLYIPQFWNGAELVNPGTLCDGGVLRAQHSPRRGRLLFFPVMSILLGISASLHTTCWAQQCGEARASGVVVSARQSQSQGSVSNHQSETPYPDVTCLPSLHLPPPEAGMPRGSLIDKISPSFNSKWPVPSFQQGHMTSFLSVWQTKMCHC